MNTAEVIKFPGPEPGQQEQRVADTDDGYTRLANELLEELIGANLTRNQAKVAFAVCRKTYGFNKKTDRIADSQLSALTRLPRQKVNKAKNELIAMKVLIKDGLAIGPNKNLSEWLIPECHYDGVNVTNTVTKSVTKTVTAMSPKQGHTKDTITKDTITKDKKDSITPIVPKPKKSPPTAYDPLTAELPEWLPADEWQSWVQYRKEIKKAIKSKQTVTQSISTLSRCREMGYSPGEIINRSIGNGWQGLFEPKQPNKAGVSRPSRPMNYIPEGFTG